MSWDPELRFGGPMNTFTERDTTNCPSHGPDALDVCDRPEGYVVVCLPLVGPTPLTHRGGGSP